MMFYEILSEEIEVGGYHEPPNIERAWDIVKADTRSKAKMAFAKKHFADTRLLDLPKMSIKALDETNAEDAFKLLEHDLLSWEDLNPETQGFLLFIKDNLKEYTKD